MNSERHDELERLKIAKAHDSRYRYYKSKGLEDSEALKLAAQSGRKTKKSGRSGRDILPESFSPETESGRNVVLPLGRLSNLPDFEPSQAEISREVDRLKSIGIMSELQISATVDNVLELPTRSPLSHVADKKMPESNEKLLVADAIELCFCGVVVLGASALLVKSSADVFGHSVEGWAKAVLLELGILGLSVCRSRSIREILVSKIGAVCLIALSFATLHSGVQLHEAQAVEAVEASSDTIQSLREERARLLAIHDALPSDHVKRREGIMHQVREVGSRLEQARESSTQGLSTKAVRAVHIVEALMRASLIFLNVVFAHRLVTNLVKLD